MKHTQKTVALLFLMSIGILCADTTATPYFSIRSQSANLPLEMVGQEGYINRYDANGNYTVLSFTPAYQQSFRSGDLACCLFGNDIVKSGDCAQLTISGSQFPNRGEKDWLADYFGLPVDFKSTIQFNPCIRNVLFDANFYFGLDSYIEGLYFRMHIPFVHTRWELDYCETVSSKGFADHPFGYFAGNQRNRNNVGPQAIVNSRNELLCNAQSFFSDCKTPELSNNKVYTLEPQTTTDLLATTLFSDNLIFEPLNYARWAGCNCSPLTKSGVAEWRFTLGYNAYMSDKFHVGFGLTGAAPTGNRPHGQFMFEPIIGNGNHWELGGQFTSHYRFWQSEDEMKKLTGYLDANLTHLFKTRQTRSFDLKGKLNSRYMLAQKLGTPVCELGSSKVSTNVPPINQKAHLGYNKASSQFKNTYAPVANLTTIDVDVNIGAQIDMALMLNYTTHNWSFDLGYNLWARTCERIKLNCDCPTRLTDGQTWALKGDAYVYGTGSGQPQTTLCQQICDTGAPSASFINSSGDYAIALNATQSNATIHSGTNITTKAQGLNQDNSAQTFSNEGIDNPRLAVGAVTVSVAGDLSADLSPVSAEQIFRLLNLTPVYICTSKDPVYLTENDLDLDGAATKGLSHKLFGHISYQWLDSERSYTPFLGFGASGEFAHNDGDCCASSCDTSIKCDSVCKDGCKRCALSQWSVWIKGGFSFN